MTYKKKATSVVEFMVKTIRQYYSACLNECEEMNELEMFEREWLDQCAFDR